ncbi:MAG TPA: glycosyltransferase, partial [Planctomycetaceae bacterium]|nr:glycosyltransferase [Planctomycetaceae bacterium]
GHSKYGVRCFLRGFLNLLTVKFLTGFGQRPQHMLGTIGLLFLGFGCLGLSYLAVLWLLMNLPPLWGGTPLIAVSPIGSRPLLAYSVAAALLGGQSLSLGLLAELIVSNTVREQETFSISERTG